MNLEYNGVKVSFGKKGEISINNKTKFGWPDMVCYECQKTNKKAKPTRCVKCVRTNKKEYVGRFLCTNHAYKCEGTSY